MKSATTLLAGLLLLGAATGPAFAQEGEESSGDENVIEMTATQDGTEFFFLKDDERNPTLELEAGQSYVIQLEVNGTHNIHIGAPVDARTEIITGGNQTLEFTIPEDAPETIEYWCDPHQFMGMAGTIQVSGGTGGGNATDDGNTTDEGNTTDDEADESNDTPAPGVLAALAVAGVAAFAFRGRRARR